MARVARAAGRSEASRRLCEEVLAAARAARDAELLAEAALLHGMDVRPGIIDRAQVALLEEASAALGERAPGLGCRVRARLATAMQPAMDPSVPIMTARDAVRRARQTGDAAVILDVLDLAAWGVYQAPLEERIAWSTELLQRALAAGDLPKALAAYAWLAFQRLETSDFEMFGRDTESMLALSAEVGHPRHRWRALLLASCRAITLGHFAESDRYVIEVVELAALIDDPAIALSLASHEVLRGRLRRGEPAAQCEAIGKVESALSSAWEGELIGATLRASCWARMEDVEATRKELAIIGSRASIIYADLTLSAYLAEAYALAGTDDQRRDVRD